MPRVGKCFAFEMCVILRGMSTSGDRETVGRKDRLGGQSWQWRCITISAPRLFRHVRPGESRRALPHTAGNTRSNSHWPMSPPLLRRVCEPGWIGDSSRPQCNRAPLLCLGSRALNSTLGVGIFTHGFRRKQSKYLPRTQRKMGIPLSWSEIPPIPTEKVRASYINLRPAV